MRSVHGLMMDAVGARAEDLGRAQQRVMAAALPWAPMAHGLALQTTLASLAQRQSAQALQAGAALPALAFDAGAVQEGLALAAAIGQQWLTLQSAWLDGLGELAEEAAQLRRVSTVSKLVDQEMSLLQQTLALFSNQATATARLAENIQANSAYWLSQKLESRVA